MINVIVTAATAAVAITIAIEFREIQISKNLDWEYNIHQLIDTMLIVIEFQMN